MPTPAHAKIPILINAGSWFEPISSEPAYLPTSIFPGETVSVRGEVRALIRQEGVPRQPGVIFSATEELQLTAIMPGINHVLPDFFQPIPIEIRYPLELEAPITLRSVERGKNVTFSWRVWDLHYLKTSGKANPSQLWNVSSKPYGFRGLLHRAAGTCLSQNGDSQLFNFISDDANVDPTRGLDMLDVLAPGAAVTIAQKFQVSDRADQYSTGSLTLELLLSEPGNKEVRFSTLSTTHRPLRSIMHYHIEVQISAKYSFNPDSRYLLVVNADTRPEVIHQVFGLVGDLEMSMDVWNLSVYGNFINPLTGRCVLFDYVGKSIIIFGNPFEYFGQGIRSAFALLDPFIISYLAAAETQFLFPETTTGDAWLGPWFTALIFPTYPAESGAVDIDRKILIATLNCEQRDGRLSTHIFTMKTQLLKNSKSVLSAETKRTARSLNEYLPLHRFSVAPVTSALKKIAGTVVVRQGLPRTSRVIATFGSWDLHGDRLSDFNTYMLIASLPFRTRAKMFWGRVGCQILDPPGGGIAPSGSVNSRKASVVPMGVVELDSTVVGKGKIPELAHPPLSRVEIDQKVSPITNTSSLSLLIIYRPDLPSCLSFNLV